MIRNVDNAVYSRKHGTYGGLSGLKDGLIIDGEDWMVKYPKNAQDLSRHAEMLYTNDPVSEFLGSNIYKILGYPVHETMLVERRNKIAVACKDFIDDLRGEKLIELRTIKNAANEKLSELLEHRFNNTGSKHSVDFDEMLLHLQYNDVIKGIDGIVDRFWNMLVIDILLNNSDRNNGNWGIIRCFDKPDRLAPVFDNGGSFNGKTPDSRLGRMLENPEVMKNSVLNCCTSYSRDEKIITAKEMLELDIPELKKAVIKNYSLINNKMDEIHKFVNEIPDEACSKIRKDFYNKSLDLRFEYLLKKAYIRYTNKNKK